jgi:hypothetical protein
MLLHETLANEMALTRGAAHDSFDAPGSSRGTDGCSAMLASALTVVTTFSADRLVEAPSVVLNHPVTGAAVRNTRLGRNLPAALGREERDHWLDTP